MDIAIEFLENAISIPPRLTGAAIGWKPPYFHCRLTSLCDGLPLIPVGLETPLREGTICALRKDSAILDASNRNHFCISRFTHENKQLSMWHHQFFFDDYPARRYTPGFPGEIWRNLATLRG
jgi:hypothetical protein